MFSAQSFSDVQLFVTLWIIAQQAPLSMKFSRQEYWNGLPCSTPGDFLNPEIESSSLASPALAGRCFISAPSWEAPQFLVPILKTYYMPTILPKTYEILVLPVDAGKFILHSQRGRISFARGPSSNHTLDGTASF